MVSRFVKKSHSYSLVGLFVAFSLLGGGVARAGEWVYTFRPGDTLWVLCNTYVAEPDCWNKIALRNEIANPKRISPGTKLYLPIAWLKVQPAKARVLTVEGEPVIALEGGNFKIIMKGDAFSVGDHLYSREGSFLLEFADGSQLMVKAGSDVLFDTLTLYGDSGMVDTRIRLNRGRVRAKVTPSKGSGSRYEIITPAAAAAVRGTVFRVSSAEGDVPVMTTEVLKGNVSVGNDKGDQSVDAGYAVKAEKGKAVLPPEALLPAPVLLPDVEQRVAGIVSEFPLTLEWQPIDGANAYRLELFIVEGDVKGDERFILEDKLIVTNKELSLLNEGRYKINIRAIDNNGFEGVDKTTEFVVLPPRVVISEVEGERWWPYVFGSALLSFLIL
ncbi:hypothetical protein A9Q81_04215 [Gammaproteobacteria bacterium 42_54_T18]|nr:hypothetical protein A9Q81_04215 [Gammaproteobacteria bacterium 42_54_T18]